MPKSEVLIEMPEFEKKYNLAMVDTEKVTSRVRPKQFLHIDEAECILCEGCVDICPWKCIHYLSVDAIDDSINCLLYTSPSPRDRLKSRMPSSA